MHLQWLRAIFEEKNECHHSENHLQATYVTSRKYLFFIYKCEVMLTSLHRVSRVVICSFANGRVG